MLNLLRCIARASLSSVVGGTRRDDAIQQRFWLVTYEEQFWVSTGLLTGLSLLMLSPCSFLVLIKRAAGGSSVTLQVKDDVVMDRTQKRLSMSCEATQANEGAKEEDEKKPQPQLPVADTQETGAFFEEAPIGSSDLKDFSGDAGTKRKKP
ncbi:unnamed protein product [Nippostrongylus brasiliensis]|uniref:Transmembrane protein n=1 Tax=Nippostrongylus brasiliensis TaxID=27835 RepID=A0A0N4XWN5_NIPBR|nr:unnamed protein product [Nippostrongylus brasiliensis]